MAVGGILIPGEDGWSSPGQVDANTALDKKAPACQGVHAEALIAGPLSPITSNKDVIVSVTARKEPDNMPP